MSDTLRVSADAGRVFRRLRESLALSAAEAARRAGRSRDTLYRFESGEDVSLSTLLAFLATVGQALEIVPAGPPTLDEMRRRFSDEDEDA